MIVWAVGGLFVGWLLSTRLRVDSLGVFLLSTVVLPILIFVSVRRLDPDVLWGYAAAWVAVQVSYLAFNLVAERSRPTADRGDGRGEDRRGSFESV